MTGDKIFALLKDLEDEDFDSLIDQEKMRSNGYKIHYILDADLIGHYCYPKGVVESETSSERLRKLNVEYLADEQVTLHSIFYLNSQSDSSILLDQYGIEVEGMLFKATNFRSPDDKKSILEFDIPNVKWTSANIAFKDMLYESFSRLYANVLLHINGLKKAQGLLKSKRLAYETQNTKNSFISRVLAVNQGSINLTNTIKSELAPEAHRRYDNFYTSKNRDALVIDRLFSFNRYAQASRDEDERKNIFVLLSDSSLAKRAIKKFFMSLSDTIYPYIGSRRINLIRNVQQVFAYLISVSYYDDMSIDHKTTLQNIEELKKASKQINKDLSQATNHLGIHKDELVNKAIFENYRRLKNAYENTGILKSFDQLYESIKAELSSRENSYVAAVFQLLKQEGRQIQNEIRTKQITYLRSLRHEATFNTVFIYGLDKIKESNESFDLSKGADYVEGSYQHLPVFIVFPKDKKDIIFHLDRLIFFILGRGTGDSKTIYNELQDIIMLMQRSELTEKSMYEINLIKSLFFMILPSYPTLEEENIASESSKTNKTKGNDNIAFQWLNRMKNDYIAGDSDHQLVKDCLYLLIWAARRVKDYPKSIEVSQAGIRLDETDPRFRHGKLLAQYCMLLDRDGSDVDLIEEIIQALDLTNELYHPFLKTHFGDFQSYSTLTKKVDDNYYNSKCFCLTLKAKALHQTKKSESILATLLEARNFLEKLKLDNNFREPLSEYYATEAFLEYWESFYSSDSTQKCVYALEAIEKARSLTTNLSLSLKYTDRLQLIKARMRELEKSPSRYP